MAESESRDATDGIANEVAGARRVARHLAAYAVVSFVLGWVVVVASLLAWALEYVVFFDAVEVLLAIGFGCVLSGLAMYASSWNMRLAATRLEVSATK